MKKGFLIAAAVFVVAGVAIFAAAFIASGFDLSKLDTSKYVTGSDTVTEDFESITVESGVADITFRPSEDGKTRVDRVERDKIRHEVSVENGTLKITEVDERKWYDKLTVFSLRSPAVTVYIPAGHYADLTITSGTGDVSVPEQFSFGGAKIRSSTGDVAFDASADGSLSIRTSTGDVRVSSVSADGIDISVSTGSIEGKNVECREKLSISVSTGETYLENVVCGSLVSAGSTGDVTLKNTVASGEFNIERSTGGVSFEDCDAGEITVKTSTGEVTSSLSSEKVFITKSSTGDIRVPDSGSGGNCRITTSTGDIRITVKN